MAATHDSGATHSGPPTSPLTSDALVFFGATGDLAYKKIFPALQSMVKRGILTVPVIGVAKSGWGLEQLRARARDSLAQHGGGVDQAAFAKLVQLLQYIIAYAACSEAPPGQPTIWPFPPVSSRP